MSTTQMKNGVIVLTTDPEQLAKLRNKLAEYVSRYHFPYLAPEVDPHATYKYCLLKVLLAEGVLDVDEEEQGFAENFWYQPGAFRDAAAIITAYNSGDLSKIVGGTGLK